MEVALEALERKLQRKLTDVGRKLEDRLDTLSASQNLVMDSCFEGGICRSLESRLSQVLENVFDVFSNKIETYSNRYSAQTCAITKQPKYLKVELMFSFLQCKRH